MMEEYTVPMLVEMTERKLIGVLESKQLGFLDYSCIANAVWSEKKFLSHQQHTKQRAPHMLFSQGSKQKKTKHMEEGSFRTTDMDEALWSLLPEHLLDRILACLPLPNLLCMRPVCKRWSSLLTTQTFLEICTKVPQKPSLLAVFEKGEHGVLTKGCYTFCPKSEKWFPMTMNSLPFKEGDQMVTSQGLLCYVPQKDGENEDLLVVCNPLTKAWRLIPLSTSIQMLFLLAVAVDQTTHAYKVIVTGVTEKLDGQQLDAYCLITQVYDSITETWQISGELPPGRLFPLHSVWCDGFLYGWCGKADQIWIYDINHGSWKGVRLQLPEHVMNSDVHLVECQGKVLLVTETAGYSGSWPQIWDLELSTMACTQIAQAPKHLSHSFFENVCEFQCVGYNDAVCFIAHEIPDVLMYQPTKKKWRWMPRCPKFPGWHPYGFMGMSLELRADIAV
jgi:hypothetical protein